MALLLVLLEVNKVVSKISRQHQGNDRLAQRETANT